MITYKIHRSADKQYYVTVQGRNGRTIYTSEMYKRKLNAVKGIIAVGGKDANIKDTTINTMKKIIPILLLLFSSVLATAQTDTADNPLTIPLPDATINGIVISRKAIAHSIEINAYEKEVILNVMVAYVGEDGKIINQPGRGIQPYMRRLVADNNFFADVTTGMPLVPVEEEYIADSTGNMVINPALKGKVYAKQYTLFRQMMKAPVIIDQMITAHILNAYQMGKLN